MAETDAETAGQPSLQRQPPATQLEPPALGGGGASGLRGGSEIPPQWVPPEDGGPGQSRLVGTSRLSKQSRGL